MEDRILLIVREVERVVTSPYPASLHDLGNLVAGSSLAAIRQWADSKPCQVPLLASALLEQLPYSSALLAKFACIQEFRDSLLKQELTVLDQFLQRAIDDGDSEAFRASISLLSCPMPQSVVAPARLGTFITKLIEEMVREPCARTISPLYHVMAGLLGNSSLLDALPEGIMANFQAECTKTLRNLNDHMGSLFCLATFARIKSLWTSTQEREFGKHTCPVWFQNLSQFFGPKRAQKTLDLVVMSVIMACSATCSTLSAEEATGGVRLAIEICENVDQEQKEIWLRSNAPRIAKLCEKLTRNGIDVNLQMTGLTFLITFSSSLSLPKEIQTLAQQKLLSEDGWNALRVLPERVSALLVERVSASLDQMGLSNMITYAISAIQLEDMSDYTALANIKIAISILSAVQKLNLPASSGIILQCLRACEEMAIMSHIENFPIQTSQYDCRGSAICHAASCTVRNCLLVELLSLFYKATVSSYSEGHDSAYSHAHEVCLLFMNTMKRRTSLHTVCGFSKCETPERFGTLLTQKVRGPFPTLFSNGSSKEWRTRIAELLLDNARVSHQSIVQQMEEICRDLEFRCHNVEAPLRAVTEERDNLHSQLEEAKQLNTELEVQAQQSSTLISNLRADIARLEEQANRASTRADNLAAQLAAVKMELDTAKRESQESAELERTKARTRELDLMATVTEREDQLDELEEEMQNLKREISKLKETREKISKERNVAIQERDQLRLEITRLQDSLDTKTTLCLEKDNQIQCLEAENKNILADVQNLRIKYEQEKANTDTLRSALDAERQAQQSTIAELKAEFEAQISKVNMDAQQEADRYRKEIGALRASLQDAESKAAKELQSKCRRIQHLERKVESLRKERAAKAREFAEAQEHISRLMNVMGFTRDRKEDHRASISGQKQGSESNRLAGLQSEEYPQSQDDTASFHTQFSIQNSILSAASRDSGHSPKRPGRSRRSRGLSLKSGQDLFEDEEPEKTAFHPQYEANDREPLRQPLGDVDRNSPRKSPRRGSKTSSYDNESTQLDGQLDTSMEKASFEDIDLEFNDEDLFTSIAAR
ncbi:hypothetical protein VTN77DRAFT_2162 [Rasamsonia byssochlamydoides]|uniref:uncharacterized protein n=1 Tax=Rasamsonia byssochlamydoides TaxID=89139 RepID=UPI00374437F2